jgi:cyclic beta-1,2-glucan synthetase
MLLNARIAAVHLGVISVRQFVAETIATLESVKRLPKYRGHLLNWYDVQTMAPLEPRFVSTVDSGNFMAALWTLKQAAIAFAAESRLRRGVTAELASALQRIAETCDALVKATDFSGLYIQRKKVLSVGFDVSAGKLDRASYDLLASESRIASFVAIAKGDVPKDAWFHLGRAHTQFRGERVLLSWTGTMFEYLMPTLWMRHYSGTITEQNVRAVVRIQRETGRRKGVPWGISESACSAEAGGDYGYAAFGIPELAMKRSEDDALVISPYSTFLALAVDPAMSLKNLRRMEEFGWIGRYGFYEAIDYTRSGAAVIRSWMAHHVGMSLLAACNLLYDNPMQRYFHAEPQVLATELLLQERVPSAVTAERDLGLLPAEVPA